ncbi:Tigger transposable element-derived protein 6, partial [Dictyocoela muelleri]
IKIYIYEIEIYIYEIEIYIYEIPCKIRKYKDRKTVMLACNMTGTHKLKQLIICKAKNPRSFKNFDKSFFCDYMYNNTAWVRSEEFNRWLYDINLSFKSKNKKIPLIVDNFFSHKISVELINI